MKNIGKGIERKKMINKVNTMTTKLFAFRGQKQKIKTKEPNQM